MGLLSWIILGLLAGFIAKKLLPEVAGGGMFITLLLGVIGATVGGYLGSLIGFGDVTGLNLMSLLLAVFGAMVVLFVYKLMRRL